MITLILSFPSYLCGAILYPTPMMAIISELMISSSVHEIALSWKLDPSHDSLLGVKSHMFIRMCALLNHMYSLIDEIITHEKTVISYQLELSSTQTPHKLTQLIRHLHDL